MQHTTRFETDDFRNGIVVSKRNINLDFTLSQESVNLSAGGYDGWGPRIGIAPIPYQSVYAAVANFLEAGSERTSEDNKTGTYPSLNRRRRTLGILGFETLLNDSLVAKSTKRVYLMICQDSTDKIRVVHTGERTTNAIDPNYKWGGYAQITSGYPTVLGGNFTRQIPGGTLAEGLAAQDDEWNNDGTRVDTRVRLSSMWRVGPVDDFLDVGEAVNWSSVSFLTITGPTFRIPQLVATVARTKAPEGNSGTGNDTPGDLCLSLTGNPNDYFYELNLNEPRTGLTFVGMQDAFPAWRIYYEWNFDEATNFVRANTKDFYWNEKQYSLSNVGTATLRSSPNTTTDIDLVYIYDNAFRHRAAYKYIGIAVQNKPYMCIWRDDHNSISVHAYGISSASPGYADNKVEFFDANNLAYFKPARATTATAGGSYKENDAVVSTVWARWPSFDSSAATTFPSYLTLGAANTGLLRANTNYEFTYSVFDKTLNYETNVGVPAKFRTGATDNVALVILKAVASGSFVICPEGQNLIADSTQTFSESFLQNINFLEYRFYYREIGTFEWLPAGQVPAAEFTYTSEINSWEFCATAIASLPGGQPGGFVDYSPLPNEDFVDSVSFQNRAYWLSRRSLYFSLRNNPLAYPVRNAVPCPRGEFRGMITHTYPGEAEQSSRLVIFGSEETYAGRFVVGAETQQRVRVGPDDAGTFPVDGSNFIVDAWTSNTSFSGRSAVVAEGVLYFWGPQGIYRDDGVRLPRKISDNLEPWIDSIFDANNTDKIHAVYNPQTDEVIWFYQAPQDASGEKASRALVYHTKTSAFYRWEFRDLVVDWARVLDDVVTDADFQGLSGARVVAAIRDPGTTISRTVYFDEMVRACDMQVDSLYLVQQVQHPSATSRRLVFATGPASIASKTGTAIVQGFQKYTGDETTNPDGIYTITGSGANYIDIERQSASADFPATSYSVENYFPVWIADEHSFDWKLESQYWAPGGMQFWGRWLYAHYSYQVDLTYDGPGGSYDIACQYFSLPGTDNSPTTTALADNSRGNCQILNSIPFTKDNASGQALRLVLSGTHLAGEWNLQYLALDVSPQDRANIRFWEG